jgi:RecQ family ATP-dependent DNA helicase
LFIQKIEHNRAEQYADYWSDYQMDEYEMDKKNTERYKNAKIILKKNFSYDSFKPHQYQIIDNILDLKDVLAVMPTGYGKSLCFQIVPLLTNEVAIVVSPLIALMADQKMILDDLGITSCCYNSTMGYKMKKEVEEKLIGGEIQILYITPESLVNSHQLIDSIYRERGICMVAIDEAHCLSSYGFDFRPKYKEIVKIRKLLPNVPVMAVTATATDKVIQDIKSLMGMRRCELIKTSFDRPNLMISVRMQSQDTIEQIRDIINNSGGSSIVYCLTKADTETLADKLNKYGISSKAYHAGLEKNERAKTQEDFMRSRYKCITATIAFGMGINKSDIRTVVHFGCPQNIESYYQEIGRAGRDGKDSNCYLYYRQKDSIIQHRFISEIKDPTYKMVRLSLLHKINQYLTTSECRRKFILKYFGQEVDDTKCTKCDNCIGKKQKIDKADELLLFQLLSTILTIKNRNDVTYGISMLTLILKGSNGQKIKPWMRQLDHYGSMKEVPTKTVNSLIHRAVEYGYLKDVDIGDCVRVLQCTDQGIRFGKKYEKQLEGMIWNNAEPDD